MSQAKMLAVLNTANLDKFRICCFNLIHVGSREQRMDDPDIDKQSHIQSVYCFLAPKRGYARPGGKRPKIEQTAFYDCNGTDQFHSTAAFRTRALQITSSTTSSFTVMTPPANFVCDDGVGNETGLSLFFFCFFI